MIPILRAFAWLRWRMFINSIEKTGARDRLERFSLAVEKLGPIIAAVLMIPSGIALAALGTAAGYALASGPEYSMLFEVCRYILFPVSILSVVGPVFLPVADRTNPVRLLLLPIARRTLYFAQTATALGDPWILLVIPLVLGVPLGLVAGGAVAAAAAALASVVLLIAILVGISSIATSVLHLVVRDRRRGEWLALVFIIVIPAVSMLPGLMAASRGDRPRGERPAHTKRVVVMPRWVSVGGERVAALLPSELFMTTTRAAARHDLTASGGGLFTLAATAAVCHLAGMFAFARVLASPGSTGARRAVPMRAVWGWRVPGLSTAASAVALAQLRLALRTPRGRSIMLGPLVMVVVFGAVMQSRGSDGPIGIDSGLALAVFGSFVALLSILPIAMNQFAVDRAGLTLALLSPLADHDYLAGKAVGNALIVAPPALLCAIAALVVFPGGSPWLWLALPIGLTAVYLLFAPGAAAASAVFPRVVDMNSIGRGSNAHGLAGLIGLLLFVVAAAPCVAIVLVTDRWLHRPGLALLALVLWCAITYGLNRLMFIPARAVFARRRENLAMMRTAGSAQ